MLVVGQGNGNIRAFVNMGNGNKPVWKEKMRFFQGVGVKEHSTPVIFDPDGNGKWVLISGSGDGGIYAFRIKGMKKGLPEWERVTGPFDSVKVDRFSVPTLVKDEKSVYLFVGQQDGRIRTFTSEIEGKPFDYRKLRFTEKGLLEGIRMNEHSSPFVSLNDGVFDIISGDYNGNLRHFLCKKKLM